MRLFGRNDLVLLSGLAVALYVLFYQPLQHMFDFVREIERTYQVQLLPALMILVGLFVFHQYRKREEVRVAALTSAAAAAEAQAAARVDASWKPPMTAWGHPDLQGIWTTDDMRGIPQQRAPEFGTRQHLTDEEFAARGAQREGARQTQDRGAVGTFRNEEGTRTFGYTSMVIDPPDGRFPPVLPEARQRRSCPR